MEVTDKLVINGSGSSKGGRFHTVEINGSGTVSGDVECTSLLFNGGGKTDGHVKTQTLTISGSGKISAPPKLNPSVSTERVSLKMMSKRSG